MKFYLAYKFLGQDKTELKSFLEEVSTIIQDFGHDSFCHFKDIQKWRGTDKEENPSQIILEAFKEVEKSDAILAFVEVSEKSEGIADSVIEYESIGDFKREFGQFLASNI